MELGLDEYIRNVVQEELQKHIESLNRKGNLEDLKKITGRGNNYCYDLLNVFKEELDIENGGFVTYKQDGVKRHMFDLHKMTKWYEENEREAVATIAELNRRN